MLKTKTRLLFELFNRAVAMACFGLEQCTRYGSIEKPIAQGKKTINSTFMLSDAV